MEAVIKEMWSESEKEALQARLTAQAVLTDDELITEVARAGKEAIRWEKIGKGAMWELHRRGVVDLAKDVRAISKLVDSRHDLIPEVK